MVSKTCKQLKMDISELRDGKAEFEFDCSPDSLSLKRDIVDLDGNARAKMSIFKTGDGVDVRGSVSFVCYLVCSRCLRRYEMNRTERIIVYYRKTGAVPAFREIELSMADAMTYYYDDNVINLASSIRDAILVFIPIKPLCSPKCKGLCPICGQDLNQGRCLCSREMVGARWEALKKFKR